MDDATDGGVTADDSTELVAVEDIPEQGSWLFTVREWNGKEEEVFLVRLADGVAAWKNFCLHEPDQRLDRGMGAAIRDGEIICPRHGSLYDACSGYCNNGEAEGTTLVDVDVEVVDGTVYLMDDDVEFAHEGGIESGDDDMPGSSSHLQF